MSELTAIQFRHKLETDGKLKACWEVGRCKTEEQANCFLYDYIQRLLIESEVEAIRGNESPCIHLKIAAALVTWGNKLFDPRPSVVLEVWRGIQFESKGLIQGGGSLGKSYSAMVWFLLDYYVDPYFTTTKLISTTFGHSKSNTYSTLARLHRCAICPMPGETQSDYIGLDSKERDAGIEIVAIPVGPDNKGALQGFHPKPRPTPHEVFGDVGRVRGFLDECEEVQSGVWVGIANMLLSLQGKGRVKVTGAYNPKDISSKTAQNAEPPGGWDEVSIETGYRGQNRWVSKEGWAVTRLDAKRFENVKERQEIYPGFVTYEGYRNLEAKHEGQSPEYFTFARGIYPPQSAIAIIIQSQFISQQRGEYTFEGSTISVAGCDIAVDGRDNCVLTRGRLGWAISFSRVKQLGNGKTTREVINFKRRRMVVQIDQQITLAKGETKIVGDGIMANCKAWNVRPENLAVDRTGNGGSIHDYLRAVWNEEVQGVDFNEKASEVKILEEDTATPLELYEGVVSEVWFALAKWLEFGYLAFAPGLRSDPLESELRSRRYVQGAGKKLRVEKKDDYKMRMGSQSPDCFIAGTMIATNRGSVPIEQVQEGDLIVTPFGHSPVVAIHETETLEITTANFSNGHILSGKGSHKIFVWGEGWKRLDSLCFMNQIESISNQPKWTLLDLFFTRAENIGFKRLVNITSLASKRTRRDFFTESSGLTLVALSLRACQSIIKMAIGEIMRFPIWRFYQTEITSETICVNGSVTLNTEGETQWTYERRLRHQKSGIAQKKVAYGTGSTPRTQYTKRGNLNAFNAERCSSGASQNIAQRVAFSALIGLRRWLKSAWFAAKSICRINTTTRNPALVSVGQQLRGTPEKVYNLTLESENAYYANGILVQNCADALTICLHGIRMRRGVHGGMIDDPKEKPEVERPRHGHVDRPHFITGPALNGRGF